MTAHHATTLNLASILEQHALRRPGSPAVVFGDKRFTYGELDAMANRTAHVLASLGIQRGDHVALSCPNLPYFPMAYYGILKIGAVVVPLNVLFKPREIAYHLKDCDAKVHLAFEGTPELPMGQMAQEANEAVSGCQLMIMTADPAGESPIDGVPSLGRLMSTQPGTTFATAATAPDDTAVILYTSGTTGQPKGAELTHLNMTLNAITSRDLGLAHWDVAVDGHNATLITLPLFHSTAQTAQMNAHVYGGGTLVLLPRFEPQAVIETMKRERVTHWIGVPTMYWTLLQHAAAKPSDADVIKESLRLCTSGGAPMPVEVMRRFEETFGVRVLEGYGLSETSPVAAFNHVAKPSRPGTVGQALFGVEIRCVDDQDRAVPAGERGEVVIRGPNVMKGYYKRPDATAEAMRNGWFHTGDIGVLDEEGYLSIVDRKKDMILRGGYNVYPREIEEVMMTHPAVSLVAVVGVPDERLGEEVKAYVVAKAGAKPTEQELIEWVKEQLASYKYPRFIEFRSELPVGPTGKILKRELKSSMAP